MKLKDVTVDTDYLYRPQWYASAQRVHVLAKATGNVIRTGGEVGTFLPNQPHKPAATLFRVTLLDDRGNRTLNPVPANRHFRSPAGGVWVEARTLVSTWQDHLDKLARHQREAAAARAATTSVNTSWQSVWPRLAAHGIVPTAFEPPAGDTIRPRLSLDTCQRLLAKLDGPQETP